MCGRYTIKTPADEWAQLLLPLQTNAPPGGIKPRFNVAPTQNVMALIGEEAGKAEYRGFRWGLVPFWAKELSIGNRMINARGETLHEKRSFAKLLDRRRCLIIADGYYEWEKLGGGGKQPHWIHPAQGGIFLMAGLWDTNKNVSEQEVASCTVVTVAANAQLAGIHDRMPAVILPQFAAEWLSCETSTEQARSMLGSMEDGFFETRPVSSFVNRPANDSSECIARIG